jgi:hypothetical protein
MRHAANSTAAKHGRERAPGPVTLIAMTMLVQVDLRAGDRLLTCWVEPRVKVGDQITLRNSAEPGLRWDVLRVGEPRPSGEIKRGWHNNI